MRIRPFVGAVLAALILHGASQVCMAQSATPFQPYIVNGTVTSAYPSTGMLLIFSDATHSSLSALCSGTLIGCNTFLTAAHCVCSDSSDDFASCQQRRGPAKPETLQIFLQHAGFVDATAVAIDPDYVFAQVGDVALITLATPVTGIAPSALNTVASPPFGSVGTIVGFGVTLAGHNSPNDDGIKRQGTVITASCTTGVPDGTNLCWQFAGSDSNTCNGDSGGPLFIDMGSGPVVAGTSSGGNSNTCGAPDMGFDSDVFTNLAWLQSQGGTDLGTSSCDLPAAGGERTTVIANTGELTKAASDVHMSFNVPPNTDRLRVVLNGQLTDAQGNDNDFDLYVRAGSAPTTETFDCRDNNPLPLGSCELVSPTAGDWEVLVHATQGTGQFQVTATTFAGAAPSCAGDCNGDGQVTVAEVIDAVNIALGNATLQECPSLDTNRDGVVTIAEIVTAVDNALNGCPM